MIEQLLQRNESLGKISNDSSFPLSARKSSENNLKSTLSPRISSVAITSSAKKISMSSEQFNTLTDAKPAPNKSPFTLPEIP